MSPTSYTIINKEKIGDIQIVTYTDQDGYEYSIQVPKDADLDQVILGE